MRDTGLRSINSTSGEAHGLQLQAYGDGQLHVHPHDGCPAVLSGVL